MLCKWLFSLSIKDAVLFLSRRALRLCIVGILTLCVCILLDSMNSSPACAQALHAVLVRSNPPEQSVLPYSPTSVQLQLSEPVQLVGQAIVVLNPNGKPASYGRISQTRGMVLQVAVDARKQGTYLVIWQVISQDTDPTSGRFVFSVGHTGGVWANTNESGVSPLGVLVQVAARWLHFLGYALGFGPFVFQSWVLLPLGLAYDSTVKRRLLSLVTLGIGCLIVAEPFALLAQNASLGTGLLFDPSSIGDVLASSFGRVLAQRLGAALLLWILVGVVKEGNKQSLTIILALGGILALIDGEASHALRTNPLWLGFIVNALHIVAMGAWMGGLCSLLALASLRDVKHQLVPVVLRFGRLATIAVLELGMTGLILAYQQVKVPVNLLITSYGNVLLIKLGVLLFALLLIALTARLHLEQRLGWWKVEAVLLTTIIVLAGLLVSLPPPIA